MSNPLSSHYPPRGGDFFKERQMKKLLSLLLLFSISMFVFAEQNNLQDLRSNGFSWYEPGTNIYSARVPMNFHICTLDKKAVIINSLGETFTLADNSCVVIGGTQLTLSAQNGGVMVKPMY